MSEAQFWADIYCKVNLAFCHIWVKSLVNQLVWKITSVLKKSYNYFLIEVESREKNEALEMYKNESYFSANTYRYWKQVWHEFCDMMPYQYQYLKVFFFFLEQKTYHCAKNFSTEAKKGCESRIITHFTCFPFFLRF